MSFDRYDEDDAIVEAHERRITRCKSCRAKVIWFKTAAGRNTPVDADTVEPSDQELNTKKHVSHWGTCPTADQHRKPR